jgi:DNA-binding MarR family transcriptional regulator
MTTIPQSPSAKPGVRPPRELLASTAYLLKRLGFAIKDRTINAFEAAGETPSHYGVLTVLDESARETQATIADALGVDRSYLVGVLDELEERGLIERKRDATDRRRHLVSLTSAGKKTLARHRAVSKQVEDEFLAPLSATERETLHGLLVRLAGHHDARYAPNGGEQHKS